MSEPDANLEPNMSTAAVSTQSRTMVAGDTFVVDATVTNNGNGTGTKTVEFEVEGDLVETRRFSLKPNETRTVTFTYRFTAPGEKTIEVDEGEKFYVQVEPALPNITVTDLEATPSSTRPGRNVTITARVTNDGHARGTEAIELRLFDETVAVRDVTLDPGASTTITFTRSIAAPGTYEAVVGSKSITIDVRSQGEAETEPSDGTTPTDVPGLGLVAGLVAVLVAGLVQLRRG